ncbi:hypothetical protein CK911_03175 [Aeromonas sp. CU5]|nr:hypothetical protein CK911_03175 [Aeromonas sp. CU5]
MTCKYRPYYEYKPTRENFMDDEMSEEDVARNIELLVDDLTEHFSAIGGMVEFSSEKVISITTDLTEEECDTAVTGYLNNLKLFAKKLP